MGPSPVFPPGPGDEPEPKPFRFTDLPAEIRNQVYAHLLCPAPDYIFDEDGHNQSPDIAPLYETGILLTSRQVHAEARDVLLRGNQFVRVFTRGVIVTAILARVRIHVVVHSHFSRQDPVVRDFRGAVMSYVLRDDQDLYEHGSALFNTCDMLIRGCDLDTFVRGVADPQVGSARMATGTRHRITIHDPFRRAKDASYGGNVAGQRRLLQPFREHFHGFTEVQVQGAVDARLAASVLREVRHEALPDPDVFVDSVTRLKDEGNALFRGGDTARASERWQGASSRLERVRASRIWPRVRAQLGPGFVDALAELFFTVHSNQAQAALAEMRGYHHADEVDRVQFALERIGHSSHMAQMASEAFGSAWRPSARQLAKLCFRSAQAARLAGDYLYAGELIDRAMELLPGDAEVQREADEIARTGLRILNELGIISGVGI